ncbi:aspartate aminotransferase family protein [Rubeoparvulum massiliense]|uniref:aspartate aminotransferase family protein n=1 Tax=Rubeoparvulum massiliense TaxID=1631346 RepID=UPI000A618753|nr:aminotransferase class III-fold pyridoxal phosphate-dependent enzyme [Rubeoparvulum massiliense]
MDELEQLDEQYLMNTYHRLPMIIERGEGNYLYDIDGNAYLDLFTGLAVNLLGHHHPVLLEAFHEQGEHYLHLSNQFYNPPALHLAKMLVDHSIPGKVFFANSGTEATDAALKLLHKWRCHGHEGQNGIVVLKNSFHGRSFGAMRMTRQASVYQDYPVPNIPIFEVTPNHLEELEKILQTEKPVAFLVEPVQGFGGIVPLTTEFLQGAEQLCRQHGVLLAVDEIQTGMGRTGKLFAYQHAGITPNLIFFGKGVGGGLPLGGIIAGKELQDLFQSGDHGSTFAPSPVSAALGNAAIRFILSGDFLQEVGRKAAYFREGLEKMQQEFPHVEEVRGLGMMMGVVMSLPPEEVALIQKRLVQRGFLINVTQKRILRFLPPLTITNRELAATLEVLYDELQGLEERWKMIG